MSVKNTFDKFIVLDADNDMVNDDALNTEAEALTDADTYITENLDDVAEDGEAFELGIYKLVKVISAVRKVTRTVTSVK